MVTPLSGWKAGVEPWRPGTAPGPCLRAAWSVGRAGVVRIVGVDVLRISRLIDADVLTVLRERGIVRGPVLLNGRRRCVEVLVRPGTASSWPEMPWTRCVDAAVMLCPAPSVTSASGLHVDGRVWITPPGYAPPVTDADALAEAVATALARRVHLPSARGHADQRRY
ncbi:hypothetical protein [Streptomyces sp. NBC_00576]|uniref:hypothetical protein n=1 Tax=Streptomyces sp. NBC_00576 TaxID=2903665 RepID=UPI002E80FC3C|nr:hypothetical protein [Streptomyces sp. NBC_00576]WUB77688.1 hypothetical protein OG734_47825 [Streptomyces sp. NBC_00576]